MAGLMAGVAVMLIMSAVAFQAWSDMLRRDNEAEMIFRAQDIVRAIQRYRRDHGGAGPDKLERLMEPGPKGQYYLRRLYEDPLVPDGKWGLLYIGPGGSIIDPNAMGQGELGAQQEGLLSKGIGSQGGRLSGALGMDDRNRSGAQAGQPGLGQPGRGGRLGQKGKGGFGSGGLQGGEGEMGGLLIAGVRTLCEDEPFRVYNGLTEYHEWMFTYLDIEQRQQRQRGQRGQQQQRQPGSIPRTTGQRPGFGGGTPTRPQGR
jgi:type II secretory pathway pseudopilin PulG